ncbi:MAG: FAD-binding oxidoreductase [Chloroflexaceae bacterium]|nr:FAD-binding oxidoreductase [Chloroflexaceae bacterium]
MNNVRAAIAAWQSQIGDHAVSVAETTREIYQTATFATTQQIPAVLYPANRDEVQACMVIANEYRVPVYPISRGKNWGYGSRVPVQDGCVVMDLAGLNRIVAFDEDLAYVTLEAGVTQQQLYEFLEERHSNLFFSATGSATDSSLVGNVLERGLGEGPYGDRFAYVCGFEVVLPTGELVHTGFGRFSGAKATPINKWGVGPYLDGLFTQSNLGIVTQMTLWLTPKPKHFEIVWYAVEDDHKLEALVDAIRFLKLSGVVQGGFVIANDIRMLSYHQQYPWAESNGQTPLSPELRQQLNQTWGDGKWSGEAAIYAPNHAIGKVVRQTIEETLAPLVDKLCIFNDEMLHLSSSAFAAQYPGLDQQEAIRWYQENPKRGIPNDLSMSMMYWRKHMAYPHGQWDPDRDRCGLIWYSPAVPFRGSDVRKAVNLLTDIAWSYGIEPSLGLNCITERNINIIAAIVYDRDVPGEDERALCCYKAMCQALNAVGYIPYRLGIYAMNDLPAVQDDYQDVLYRLKQTFDPNHILAPGRYEPKR